MAPSCMPNTGVNKFIATLVNKAISMNVTSISPSFVTKEIG